jgi:SH3-like domain-containing protein
MRRSAAVVAPLVAATLLACAAPAVAEIRGVASAAVLYDGPSKQARKLFAAPRGMPLEVISTLGQWVKGRDVAGDVVWIERTDLGERRSVVTSGPATVRREPQDAAAVVLQADRGVLLDLADPAAGESPAGWVRVRHRDGSAGFVRATEVWGL